MAPMQVLNWAGSWVWGVLLWITGRWDALVAAWFPEKVATVLLSPRSHQAPLSILVIVGCLILLSYAKGRKSKTKNRGDKKDVKMPAEGGLFLWGIFTKHEQRVKVGRLIFDVAWRHIGILGTSGARKSTLMALLLEQIGKTYACLTGDHSPPLLNLTLSRGGIVWTPRGKTGWYPWGGPLEHAVQRVEHMFPASGGDVGVHRSMFKLAARLAWAENEADFEATLMKRVTDPVASKAEQRRNDVRQAAVKVGVSEYERTVEQVMALLPVLATGTSGKTMAENWIPRLQELVESLGTSLCTASEGGFDLVEQLKLGVDVMFALNSFADVSNRERFAKIAILEILRASDSVGNLSAAIDEVGLLGAELFAESVRTLRVRKCTGLFASHISDDFPKVLKGLINIWFLGQLPGSDKATRQWESDTTFNHVPPEHFGEHALPLGDFYVSANGRIQRMRVPTWRTRPVPALAETYDPFEPVIPDWGDVTTDVDDSYNEAEDPIPPPTPPERGPGGGGRRRSAAGRPSVTVGEMEPVLRLERVGTTSGATARVQRTTEQVWLEDEERLEPEEVLVTAFVDKSPWEAFNSSARWLKVWEDLGKPTREDECWMVDEKKVQSGGRASFSMDGDKITATDVYRKFGEPNGKIEAKAKGAKWQLDHDCHTRDATCPGGDQCKHKLCVNPFQKVPVTTSENMAKQKQQQRAHTAWLAQQHRARMENKYGGAQLEGAEESAA